MWVMNNETLDIIIKAILIPLLPLVSAYIAYWADKYAKKLKQEREMNERFTEMTVIDFYIDIVNNAIQTAVAQVNQTFVSALKKEGIFTKEKHTEALKKAKDIVDSLVTSEGQKIFEKAHNDYGAYVEGRIEQIINEIKK